MMSLRKWLLRALLLSAILAIPQSQSPAEEKTGKSVRPFGLQRRVPWTTSNFRGRPEPPPPYRAERVYSRLRFTTTTVLATAPGSDRFFVGEQTGKIYSLPRKPDAAVADPFLDCNRLVERLNRTSKQPLALEALYGLTFDPDFAKNRYCYVCYVVRERDRPSVQLPDGTRVSRLRVSSTDPPQCDIESEQLIISWLQGGHNGGCLKFGLDGCLYISSGDGGFAFPPDGLKAGQDVTHLLSKILRIDVRRSENGRPYAIPADNPFVKLDKARGETWAYGLRNPWKMSFDRRTGDLWVGDVGWELWELVYRVNKGDNFGWSIVEGPQSVHAEGQRGPTPIVPPTMEIPHTEGASITGGFVYRGKKFHELDGTYIFGDWETRRIWGAKVEGSKLGPRRELMDPVVRIVDFAEDHDGELYLLDHDDGSIYTLARNEVKADAHRFPRRLSETGIFQSVAKHEVAAGVLPFSINVEQWSDGATAERFIGVPDRGVIRMRPTAKLVPGSMFSRATDYPRDTVLLKTLSLEMVQGEPASRRRIETQVLHYDGRDWQAYTYEWNDAQTDAALVGADGMNRTFQVRRSPAAGVEGSTGRHTHTWRFAARTECIRCHNPWSEFALAFNVPQLNRSHDYGGYGGVSDNQIRTLRHIGMLADVADELDPNDPFAKSELPRSHDALPRLTPPFDAKADINDRARSYLHVNCGHCHRFNGGGSAYFFLQHDLPLRETKAIGVRPTQGTFGIHDAQILAPGDPYRSVLYFRLAKIGPGHMPHLGAKMVDERALPLIRDWIRQLPVRLDDAASIDRLIELDEPQALAREKAERPRTEWQIARRLAEAAKREKPNEEDRSAAKQQAAAQAVAAVRERAEERRKLAGELLSAPSRAVMLAEALRQNRLPATTRKLVLDAALSPTTDQAIRDLFEAFLPEEERTQRLGDTIRPDDVLKLAGDATRGRQLFHESTVVQCRNCHRIDGKGTELGPDLDAIGKKYERAKLLESILQPSLQIEPKYVTWLVETKSGKVVSGLLARRDNTQIVLRDAQNKEHRIAADDVERALPQQKSLMPDMLLRDFTAQQVADLVAYLTSQRSGEASATQAPEKK
jgi:putative heme-binding domain-containing protein